MRLLIALHRWWGVVFCLLFAAWFASGIVMHFVPYPAPSEADYFAGLVAIDSGKVKSAITSNTRCITTGIMRLRSCIR